MTPRSGESRITLGRVGPTGVGRITLGRVLEEIVWRDVSLTTTVWQPVGLQTEIQWCREAVDSVMWQEEVVG